MARRSGQADLPLHHGRVPRWLAERMQLLGGAIIEAIVQEFGKEEVLRRLSDPFWFQSLGCVLGMDWHSSGITTAVMGALKRSVNSRSKELGIYICGGRGKQSLKTPEELMEVADKVGLDGDSLVRYSRLSAKVDNAAVQDGFQLYLHNFIVLDTGAWAVVQQGLNGPLGMARRYHWHAAGIESFVDSPHAFVTGTNQGLILNLAHREAKETRKGIMGISRENPAKIQSEFRRLSMPRRHNVRPRDVAIKRLGSVLALAQENEVQGFEDLLLTKGLGPRTLQSITLISELVYGTPSRFQDPARFSFAHGGKDGHPFPVPLNVYDESISVLRMALDKAKVGDSYKKQAFKSLHKATLRIEKDFRPNNKLQDLIRQERERSYLFGGRSVFGRSKPSPGYQLDLFAP